MLALALALSTLTQADVKLRTLEGQTVSGALVRLTDAEIVLSVNGKEMAFSSAKLDTLGVRESAAAAKWNMQVALSDGSLLQGSSYSVAQGKASVVLADGSTRELPLKSVVSVRLREQSGELAKQWNEYLAQAAASDRLVVRRKGDAKAGGVESLDVLEGVIKDVTETTIVFDAGGGDVLKVKRERVDGLIYFRGREPAPAAAACLVVDIDDSRWAAKTLQLAGQAVKLVTSSGLTVDVPLERIRKLDYAASNRRFLSELPRDSLTRETWLSSDPKESAQAFAPQVGRTPEGPLVIGGELCPRGVWLPAKSVLIVRTPAGFTRFQTQVGIDDRVANTDGARLKIEADGKTLFDELIKRDPQATPVSVDLQDARRLRITVDYGGQSYLGDQLVLCEAMFIK